MIFVGVGLFVKPIARAIHARFPSEATRLFLKTMPRHPMLAGILCGLFVDGLPAPTLVGDHPVALALYYGSAGGLCTRVYDAARERIKRAGKGEA